MRYVEKGLIGCIDEPFHDGSNGSNGQHWNGSNVQHWVTGRRKIQSRTHAVAQALVKSKGVFHMMEEAKTAGSAPGGAAAAADAAERTPTIQTDEMARMGNEIVGALKTVYDPEIPADLYELGLIYKVVIEDDRMVNIEMTLTSPSCPSAAELPGQVKNAVAGVSGVRDANVTIVWDPPWEPSRMSDEARTDLNMW
jgi:FeS assembly SUF system protein